jgi:hypothetical protein
MLPSSLIFISLWTQGVAMTPESGPNSQGRPMGIEGPCCKPIFKMPPYFSPVGAAAVVVAAAGAVVAGLEVVEVVGGAALVEAGVVSLLLQAPSTKLIAMTNPNIINSILFN